MITYAFLTGSRWAIRLHKSFKHFSLIAGLLSSSPVFAVCTASDGMLKALNHAANVYKLEPSLVIAIAHTESCFGKYAYNARSHDYGLMQLNARTLASIGMSKHTAMHDNHANINAALKLLVALKKQGTRHGMPWQCRYNVGNKSTIGAKNACKAYLQRLRLAGWSGA